MHSATLDYNEHEHNLQVIYLTICTLLPLDAWICYSYKNG